MDEVLRAGLTGGGEVTLRRWRAADEAELTAAVAESLEHLRPWMPWAAGDYGPAEAKEFLERSRAEWEAAKTYNYAIIASDGRIVGACGLMTRIGPGGLEIGYWLHPGYTGRGLATASAAALVAAAWTRPEVDRVEIHHAERNARSGLVPRRLGFREVGRVAGEDGAMVVWRLDRP